MPDPAVLIVGGGAAGLSAAGALARRGIESVVLEQDAALGGTWARRYPKYLSRNDLVSYLDEYARAFTLRIVTGTSVTRIAAGTSAPHRWTVETGDGPAWEGRVVVVATGQYRQPVMPEWPGRDQYTGRLSHSAEYMNASPYVRKRVLVVGAGNSGAEIATDLADNGAAFVAVSVRTPPTIVPRDPFGTPVQRTSLLLSALPAAVANRIGMVTARLTIGDLTRYGLPKGTFEPYTTRRIPLIDVGFVDALKRGRVVVRPALQQLTATGAVFEGGTREEFDAIVAATGFSTGLPSLLDVPGALDETGEPRATSGEPTPHLGLYFVGFVHSLRGHLLEARRASIRLAAHIERYLR